MVAKVVIAAVWVVCVAGVLAPLPAPFYSIAFWMLVALVVSHAIETVVFANRVTKAEGNKVVHFVQLFLFGYFHANELPK